MKLNTDPFDILQFYILDEFFIEDIEGMDETELFTVTSSVIQYHLIPLIEGSKELGHKIEISRRSCFRSVEHEKSKGRSGLSSHTFATHEEVTNQREHKGAVDVTLNDDLLDSHFYDLGIVLSRLPYTRICCYPNNNFYHCDYMTKNKHFYICDTPTSDWKPVRFEQMLEAAEDL